MSLSLHFIIDISQYKFNHHFRFKNVAEANECELVNRKLMRIDNSKLKIGATGGSD